jgi:hypothetical protein
VDDGVNIFARPPERWGVAHVCLKKLQSRHRLELATVVHGVVDGDVVAGIEELRDQEGAHISGSAGDENIFQAKIPRNWT